MYPTDDFSHYMFNVPVSELSEEGEPTERVQTRKEEKAFLALDRPELALRSWLFGSFPIYLFCHPCAQLATFHNTTELQSERSHV